KPSLTMVRRMRDTATVETLNASLMALSVQPGPPAAAIEDTRRFWRERTGQRVSAEEAREAIGNVAALFDLLTRWDDSAVSNAESEPEDRGLAT
ncbi:MAG: hypothetical protein NTW28_24640, partial [Candidatus Solibacter sp.]|nr:hypothetical protein [Candidatus Solibacter sp.]